MHCCKQCVSSGVFVNFILWLCLLDFFVVVTFVVAAIVWLGLCSFWLLIDRLYLSLCMLCLHLDWLLGIDLLMGVVVVGMLGLGIVNFVFIRLDRLLWLVRLIRLMFTVRSIVRLITNRRAKTCIFINRWAV